MITTRLRPSKGCVGLDVPEIVRFRHLLAAFAERDVKLRYRQTILGALWVVIQPLFAAGIFSFVFGVVAGMDTSSGQPYFIFSFAGLLACTAGSVRMQGRDLGPLAAEARVAAGLSHVAEGRRIFRAQSVDDNLELGAYAMKLSRAELSRRRDECFALFPILATRRHLPAGSLSGGQQQMLAIAQALLRTPRLLMLDEPSLGLAPVIVDQVMDVIVRLRAQGCAIVLVEQLVERALEVADVAYVLRNGRIIGSGRAAELHDSELIRHAYLGV